LARSTAKHWKVRSAWNGLTHSMLDTSSTDAHTPPVHAPVHEAYRHERCVLLLLTLRVQRHVSSPSERATPRQTCNQCLLQESHTQVPNVSMYVSTYLIKQLLQQAVTLCGNIGHLPSKQAPLSPLSGHH